MAEHRVKLDLTAFYTDYKRQSYILIKREWSTVKDLKEHVEKTFNLANVEFLTSDEVYLPPFESIDIINLNDEIKAIAGYEIVVPSRPKKKKIEDVDSKDEDERSFLKEALVEGADSESKGKRKRKRKRKTKEHKDEVKEPLSTSLELPKKLPQKIEANRTAVTHIHFDDDENAVDSNPFEISFVNYLDSQDNIKARIVGASVKIERGGQSNEVTEDDKTCITLVKELIAV